MQTEQLCEDPCGWQQDKQLSGHRDDQAVHTVPKCLKDRAEDDAEACKQVAPADDAQRVRAD